MRPYRYTLWALFLNILSHGQVAEVSYHDYTTSFWAVDTPIIALPHVKIIDASSRAPQSEQTIWIEHDKIKVVGPQHRIWGRTSIMIDISSVLS